MDELGGEGKHKIDKACTPNWRKYILVNIRFGFNFSQKGISW